MPSDFQTSIFHGLFHSHKHVKNTVSVMGGLYGSSFPEKTLIKDLPIVIFDFETTGLDAQRSHLIEVGAIKYEYQKETEVFHSMVQLEGPLPPKITQITGITANMLKDAPPFSKVLGQLHPFMEGCLCVAHNAEFDSSFLRHQSDRLGIKTLYTTLCTLKMSRDLVMIERRNLDSLAKHFELEFESRHRSLGDIRVTADVLWCMLRDNPQLKFISDLKPYLLTV